MKGLSGKDIGNSMRAFYFAFVLLSGCMTGAARPEDLSPDDAALMSRLVRAYPETLSGSDGNSIIWRDGTRMPFGDGVRGKPFDALIKGTSLRDQFAFAYPKGPVTSPPALNFDPGRIRYEPFFDKMYGRCEAGEVARKLVAVDWLPKHGGGKVTISSVNGIDKKLRAISAELDELPQEDIKYVRPLSGSYNCRKIAQASRKSMHAYGAAIDINARFAGYWLWPGGAYGYRNRIPYKIAAIFEKHGFIWGAKWYHFDTMHFEYRPELIQDDAE